MDTELLLHNFYKKNAFMQKEVMNRFTVVATYINDGRLPLQSNLQTVLLNLADNLDFVP